MEVLNRGLVAIRISSTQAYVGWRMLGTDPDDIAFNLYRSHNGGIAVKINGSQPITATTDFVDTPPGLSQSNIYYVRPVIDGIEQIPSNSFTLAANQSVPKDHQNNVAPYLSVPLQVPAEGTSPDSAAYTYSPNDCSVGDLDGDGELEIVLKWDPSNSKDNSQNGYTGNVFLDAYKLDGTYLWRIDLGINIRAGAHYTQFMVFDFDGDGKAEVACKTAEGSRDATGTYVANTPARFTGTFPTGVNNAADHRNSSGRILTGYEFLTLFNGETGAELATTYYNPPRNNNINSSDVSAWGDNYGNRVDRFLAGVAYLDGVRPSLIMCRGYYTRSVLAAWDWRDGQLTQRWVFDSDDSGNGGYAGQGNHNLSVADVDGDGKDEIIYGACGIDDDGTGLYTTGFHHGDALHVSDMDPDRAGLEVWDVHESGPTVARGGEFRDAMSGALIWGIEASDDVGRGLAAHVDSSHKGFQMWSSATAGVLKSDAATISANKPSINFAVWWDGDLQRELLDNAGGGGTATKLDKWTGNGVTRFLSPYSVDVGTSNNNGTKSNPCLSGDILGDWREEMIFRSSDNSSLMIFVSPHSAVNRFRTLLHDSQYRVALAWQNVAYNQPPHPCFYIGAGMSEPAPYPVSAADLVWAGDGSTNSWEIAGTDNWRINGSWTNKIQSAFAQGDSVLFDITGSSNSQIALRGSLQPSDLKVHSPADVSFIGSGSLNGAMNLTKAGTGTLTLNTTNDFTGATTVWEGGLVVNGLISQSPLTVKKSVWLDSHVGGSGVLGQGLTMEAGFLTPGALSGQAGTLTVSNALTLADGVVHRFDLSDDPAGLNDRIQILGNLNMSGVNKIEINALAGMLTEGIYPLLEYTGNFNGSIANFQLAGDVPSGTQLIQLPDAIALMVSTNIAAGNMVWQGGNSGNLWDHGSTPNWNNGIGQTVFTNGAAVTFNDSGAPHLSVSLAGTLSPGSVTVNSSQNYTFGGSGLLSGAMSLTKTGSGALTLTNTNAYSGGTLISEGMLTLENDAANESGVGSGPVTLRNGVLTMNNSAESYTPVPWDIVVPAGANAQINADSRCDMTGSLTGAGQLSFWIPYVRTTLFGDWSGFTGALNIITDVDGCDFRVANPAGLPDAKLHLADNIFMYSRAPGGSVIPIGEFAADAGATVSAGFGSSIGVQNAVTWRVGGLNTDATNAASIVGTTTLIKEGTGQWILTTDSDYSGSTTVNDGWLVVNGYLANTDITVTGGTLGGLGILGGTINIGNGGTLSPGNSIGTLTVNNTVSLQAGSTVLLEISKLPLTNDQLATSDTLSYSGTLVVTNVGGGTLTAGDEFTLFDAPNYAGAFSAIELPTLGNGFAWNTADLPISGTIHVESIEPPVIDSITIAHEGTNLFMQLSGSGGTPGSGFLVVGTTNLFVPPEQWSVVDSNSFNTGGLFSITNMLDRGLDNQFFRVVVP